MQNADQMCSILRNIPVFNGFGAEQLRMVIPLLEQSSYPGNTRIIRQGDRGDSMFIIYSGSVRVSRSEKNRETVELATLYGGSYFGELSLIDELPRSADVTTLEDTVIFRLTKFNFDSLLRIDVHSANIFYRNCLLETFSRFRDALDNFTFSQHVLQEQGEFLERINKDLSVASLLQGYFINAGITSEEKVPRDFRFSYVYEPCLAIGGDFLSMTHLDNGRAGIFIADVEGHGISAALATGVLKSALSIVLPELGCRPVDLMKFLNTHMMTVVNRLYVTCYYACLDSATRTVTFAKAGHHHPLFWRAATGDFEEVECSGPALGLLSEPYFTQKSMEYGPGDRILFYTDGIIEQMNPFGEMYGRARLYETGATLFRSGGDDILKRFLADMRDFSGNTTLGDDVTLLLLEF